MLISKKLSICVVFGGKSSEHDISKISAKTVLDNLNTEKYEVHKLFITCEGEWYYYTGSSDEIKNIPEGSLDGIFDRAVISPSVSDKGILRFTQGGVRRIAVDAAVPVLHGKNGEDGTVQGLFELAGIPYVGPGVIGSAVCMDKCMAKILFKEAGIPQADWVTVKYGDDVDVEEIENKLGYPCFIKPSNAGSSVGISKAHDRSELIDGIKLAFENDYKVLIEEYIEASEVESAVIGNFDPEVAPNIGEIAPANEFYDFDAKYKDESSKLTIPANIDKELETKLKEYAIKAYKICECRGLSRVDFFVNKSTGDIRLNEINTLPGFTSISMYPKMWEVSGVSNTELIDRLIDYALALGDKCHG